jgi:serine/threonine protein kinase
MELLRGETLRAKVERQGRLSAAEVTDLFIPICDAVATLHDAGIVHRDLKLCNVLLAERASKVVPTILDFGISKDLVATGGTLGVQTTAGAFVGTPRYLSPEQTLDPKAASPLSDQYAVGIMLYECLTGKSPFAAEVPYALMHAILTAPVAAPSEAEPRVDPGLDALVLRAMDREPRQRFPSMRALARALREARAPAPAVPTEPFHEVRLLEPRIVVVRRSSRQFANDAEVAEERRRIGAALDELGRQHKRLLVDSRHAPLSTDDRLAAAFLALRGEIGRDFERTAVVVSTKIGILQANRLNRQTAVEGALAAFETETEALAFLKS